MLKKHTTKTETQQKQKQKNKTKTNVLTHPVLTFLAVQFCPQPQHAFHIYYSFTVGLGEE